MPFLRGRYHDIYHRSSHAEIGRETDRQAGRQTDEHQGGVSRWSVLEPCQEGPAEPNLVSNLVWFGLVWFGRFDARDLGVSSAPGARCLLSVLPPLCFAAVFCSLDRHTYSITQSIYHLRVLCQEKKSGYRLPARDSPLPVPLTC